MYGTYQKQFMFFRSGGIDLETNVEASAADIGYISVPIPIEIVGFGLQIVDEVVNYDNATPTEAVISLDYRPIEDSDDGREEIATITIPANAALESMAIGEVLMSKIPLHNGGYQADPGGQLVLEVKVAGLGTTETGEYKAFIVFHDRGEVPGNFANTVTVVEE
uniref:Uncharacterized protein n=1 Tax=viral metagenome TaxID=1070528 RepID=A0A6M3IG46_9ZZZZ